MIGGCLLVSLDIVVFLAVIVEGGDGGVCGDGSSSTSVGANSGGAAVDDGGEGGAGRVSGAAAVYVSLLKATACVHQEF